VRGGENWQAAVELLEQQGVPRIDAETYADIARSFTHSDWNWLQNRAKEYKAAAAEADGAQETTRLGVDPAEIKFYDSLVNSAKEIHRNTP